MGLFGKNRKAVPAPEARPASPTPPRNDPDLACVFDTFGRELQHSLNEAFAT
jgi:hypothetical protein